MTIKPEQLTARQLTILAQLHIRHFRSLLESNRKDVRPDECRMYLGIWEGLLSRIESLPEEQTGIALNRDERSEILDAIDSGEYDDVIALA